MGRADLRGSVPVRTRDNLWLMTRLLKTGTDFSINWRVPDDSIFECDDLSRGGAVIILRETVGRKLLESRVNIYRIATNSKTSKRRTW